MFSDRLNTGFLESVNVIKYVVSNRTLVAKYFFLIRKKYFLSDLEQLYLIQLNYGGLVFGSSQFLPLHAPKLPQKKPLPASKVVKIDTKIINLLRLFKSVTHSVVQWREKTNEKKQKLCQFGGRNAATGLPFGLLKGAISRWPFWNTLPEVKWFDHIWLFWKLMKILPV